MVCQSVSLPIKQIHTKSNILSINKTLFVLLCLRGKKLKITKTKQTSIKVVNVSLATNQLITNAISATVTDNYPHTPVSDHNVVCVCVCASVFVHYKINH